MDFLKFFCNSTQILHFITTYTFNYSRWNVEILSLHIWAGSLVLQTFAELVSYTSLAGLGLALADAAEAFHGHNLVYMTHLRFLASYRIWKYISVWIWEAWHYSLFPTEVYLSSSSHRDRHHNHIWTFFSFLFSCLWPGLLNSLRSLMGSILLITDWHTTFDLFCFQPRLVLIILR